MARKTICYQMFVYSLAPFVCEDPAHVAIPLGDVTMTVQGELIQLSCLFKGNLALLETSLTSYWRINLPPAQQHNGPLYIHDNSTDLYRIAVYQTCSGASCCNFLNKLTILDASLSLNNARLTCTESLSIAGSDKPVEYTSNTTIGKCMLHTCMYVTIYMVWDFLFFSLVVIINNICYHCARKFEILELWSQGSFCGHV